MTATRRITVEEVLEAYRVTGLKPVRGSTTIVDGRCCPIGALLESKFIQDSLGSDERFGREYGMGFVSGFDDCPSGRFKSPRFDDGYADGRAAAEAVFGAAV
jgi:hypothetical protein